jgi:hypothetical protein
MFFPDHYADIPTAVTGRFSTRTFSEGRKKPVIGLQRHPLIFRFSPAP